MAWWHGMSPRWSNHLKGQLAGRPSKSLTLEQAIALMDAAKGTRLEAYITVTLLAGLRTEEVRALRWDHVVA